MYRLYIFYGLLSSSRVIGKRLLKELVEEDWKLNLKKKVLCQNDTNLCF